MGDIHIEPINMIARKREGGVTFLHALVPEGLYRDFPGDGGSSGEKVARVACGVKPVRYFDAAPESAEKSYPVQYFRRNRAVELQKQRPSLPEYS